MKVLAAIANFGGRNQPYLDRLLAAYRTMPIDVDVVILSNVPLDKGADVEVIVGMPSSNPYSLPFAHRQLFADRKDGYDLFIFSEDDTLVVERNIRAFLEVTSLLGEDLIAGFLRTEQASDGTLRVSTVHHRFYWDPASVFERGGETFAQFTNMHSGAFMLTRDQLSSVQASGGFLVPPHEGQYAMRETAATDVYTQCGLRKVICISRVDDFLLPHLPNKYVDVMGLQQKLFMLQIEALFAVLRGKLPATRLCNTVTRVHHCTWSKNHYEAPYQDIIKMVPAAAGSVLSLGCGWGATEETLIGRGIAVTAAPLDAVIGSCAAARGVEVVHGTLDEALCCLEARHFDCLIISNLLHLVADPVALIQSCSRLLNVGGTLIAAIPNFNTMHLRLRRLLRDPLIPRPAGFAESGLHAAPVSTFRDWFRQAGMRIEITSYTVPPRMRKAAACLLHMLDPLISREVLVRARLP